LKSLTITDLKAQYAPEMTIFISLKIFTFYVLLIVSQKWLIGQLPEPSFSSVAF
jgi:hypothetical protein